MRSMRCIRSSASRWSRGSRRRSRPAAKRPRSDCILQLLPIAFVFRVRANQEYAVLAGVLFALYATERARTGAAWSPGCSPGSARCCWSKGVFAVMVPVDCVLWLAPHEPPAARRFSDAAAWAAIVAMPVAGALIAWGYESAYVHATGQSFLEIYRSRQLPEAGDCRPVARRAHVYTATWYLTRVAGTRFPGACSRRVSPGGDRCGTVAMAPWRASVPPRDEDDGAGAAGGLVRVRGRSGADGCVLARAPQGRSVHLPGRTSSSRPAGAGPALRRWPRLARLARRRRSAVGAGGALRRSWC